MRPEFEKDLQSVEQLILEMGKITLDSILASIQSLTSEDVAIAEKSRQSEKLVDALYDKAKRQILVVSSLQAPVASDLRMLLNSAEICNEVERTADYANNIAKLYQKVLSRRDLSVIRPLFPKLEEMGKLAAQMLERALTAYRNKEDILASIEQMDNAVDHLNKEMFQALLAISTQTQIDSGKLEVIMYLHVVARYVERVADRAVNITEQVHHLVSGFAKTHSV